MTTFVSADSFDVYANLAERWDGFGGAVLGDYGARKTKGVQLFAPGTGGAAFLKRTTSPAAIFGFRHKLLVRGGDHFLTEIYNSVANGDIFLLKVRISGSNKIYIIRQEGFSGSVESSPVNIVDWPIVDFNRWTYFDILYSATALSACAGGTTWHMDYEVWMDDVQVINASYEICTQLVMNVGNVYIGNRGNIADQAREMWIDDSYFTDGRLGDIRVQGTFPKFSGTYTEWTAIGASGNWGCVDELAYDSDVTRIETDTINKRDSYNIEDVDFTGTISTVKHRMVAKTTLGGGGSVAPLLRQGGTDLLGTTRSLGSGYTVYEEFFGLAPDGGAWDVSKFNALEIGVKSL